MPKIHQEKYSFYNLANLLHIVGSLFFSYKILKIISILFVKIYDFSQKYDKIIPTNLDIKSIKNVSIKTIGKMAALNAIYSAPFTVFNGLFTNGAVISPAY